MVELYRVLGDEVRSHFGDLRPAQVEALEAQLAEVDGGKGYKQQKAEAKVEVIQTNINPKGGNAKKQPAAKVTKSNPTSSQDQQAAMASEGKSYSHITEEVKASNQSNYEEIYGNELDQENEQVCNFCGRYDENFN